MKSNRERVQNSRKSLAIFDCHAICHYIKHGMMNLGYMDQNTGIIFGFLTQFLFIQKQLRCKDFLFCWDSKSNIRKKLFPDYKKGRTIVKMSEEEAEENRLIYEQFDIIRDQVLPKIGFSNSWKVSGLEADDVIAELCANRYSNAQKIIISRDNDLWQLINHNTICFDFMKRQTKTMTGFHREWGIHPRRWGDVKAIAGCSGDGVPGIYRVGNKTAIKYLNGKLSTTTQTYKNIISDEGQEIIHRNKDLVILPSPNPVLSKKPFRKKLKIKKDNFSWEGFEEVCLMYGFDSFLEGKKEVQWKKTLGIK